MKEDVHFYIDSAPPEEVMYVLRSLTSSSTKTSNEINDALRQHYGFEMQRDKNYSPRRLYDLGVASRSKRGNSFAYMLSPRGSAVQAIASSSRALGYELLHLLHFNGYRGRPADRKLFWSYRRICELIWAERRVRPSGEIASEMQSAIESEFPSSRKRTDVGHNFSSSGVNQALAWLRALEPCPLLDNAVLERQTLHPPLAALVLNAYYEENGLAYGSPITLTEQVLTRLGVALFVSPTTLRMMLEASAVLLNDLSFSETLGGTAVRLRAAFGLEDFART